MLKKSLSFALLVLGAASASADILYNNTNVTSSDTFIVPGRSAVADDFTVAPTNTTPVKVDSMELGFYLSQASTAVPASFRMQVSFYGDMDTVTTSATTPVLSNFVKSYTLTFSNVTTRGVNFTGVVNLAQFGGGFTLPSVSNATNSHGVDIKFLNLNDNGAYSNALALFKGDEPAAVGSSLNLFYSDMNGNGFLDGGADKQRIATATGLNGSVYMRLQGQPVPEPATMSVLALGAAAMLRRRKRA